MRKRHINEKNSHKTSGHVLSKHNKQSTATIRKGPQSLLNFLADLNKIITGQTTDDNMTVKEYTQEMRSYYESIIACMPSNVYWLDRNCVLLGGNDNLAKMFGLQSHTELVGLTYEQMTKLANWTEGQGESFKQAELEVMATGIPRFNVDEPPVIIDGKTRYYISSKVPLYSIKGEIIGVVGISTDITERKEAEAFKEAKERAEIANKTKTEFLENMSHDLRTPLVGIAGFANIIAEEVNDPRIKEYVDNLTTSSHALLDLLNEILEVVKVTSGNDLILSNKFDLKERLYGVIKLNRAKASQKNIHLVFEYDDKIAPYLLGDSKRIHRIVLELITNALNFTEKGSVKLTTQLAKIDGQNFIIKIIVEDTGIGIEPKKQQEIYQLFKRLTPSYDGRYKGAGLGLALVKQFVDDLQGEIYVESQVGVGTKFTCILSLKKSLLDEEFGSDGGDMTSVMLTSESQFHTKTEFIPIISKASDERKSRILVVEDQEIAAKVVSIMLSTMNCHVDIARDGKTAIQRAQKNNYHLIFMDIGLPDMDGYEVTRRIRLHELNKEVHTPIVALSAHVDEANKQRCIEVGMNAVFTKPLEKEKAEGILSAFIPYRNHAQEIDSAINDKERGELLTLTGKTIDLAESKKVLGDGATLTYDLLKLLINELPTEVENLDNAYKAGNWQVIQAIAHKIKGGSSYCGAVRLKEACSRLEIYIKEGKKELLADLYQQMLFEMKAVEEAVKNKKF